MDEETEEKDNPVVQLGKRLNNLGISFLYYFYRLYGDLWCLHVLFTHQSNVSLSFDMIPRSRCPKIRIETLLYIDLHDNIVRIGL